MTADEVIGPLFKDHIHLTVLNIIDPRLPSHIKEYCKLKMGDKELTDVKKQISLSIQRSLSQI